nr:MAG: cap-pol fusion protein [Sclerotinia sclerotiorum botybirnavirus 2-WX]
MLHDLNIMASSNTNNSAQTVFSANNITSSESKTPTTKKAKANKKQLKRAEVNFFNGYCYLALIHSDLRAKAHEYLGAWPLVSEVEEFIGGDWDRYSTEKVGVQVVPYPTSDSILVAYHITMGNVFPSEILDEMVSTSRVGGTPQAPADTANLPPPVSDPEFGDVVDEPADPENPSPNPPEQPEPENPGSDNPSTRYDYIKIDSGVADKPESEGTVTGMMDWDAPDFSGSNGRGGSLFSKAGVEHTWTSKLYPKFRNSFVNFDALVASKEGNGSVSIGNMVVGTAWGYGSYTDVNLAAKPFFVDNRTIPYWTSDQKKETLDTSKQQVLYDAPISITPAGRAVGVSSLLVPGMKAKFQKQIGDHTITNHYFGNMLSTSGVGDSHLAALTIACTRLMTVKIQREQEIASIVEFDSEEYDDYFLQVGNTDHSIYRKVAVAANDLQSENLVFLPPGSRIEAFPTMAYLLGMGRTTARVPTADPTKKQIVYSPFDRFCSRQGFAIVPIIDGKEYTGRYAGPSKIEVTLRECESVLASYVDYHGLWSQLAMARALAFAIMSSPNTASLTTLPKPNHTSDMQIGLNGRAIMVKNSQSIVDPDESYMALIAASTILSRSAEEALLEAIIFTAESAGYSPFSFSFKAVIDQFLGDSLPWGLSHATIPVFSKLMDLDLNDLVLCIDRHMVGCISKLLLGFNNRLFRASSYMMLKEQPNSTELLAVHKKSVRDSIASRRALSERESKVLQYLTQTGVGNGTNQLFYHDVYSDDLTNDRSWVRLSEAMNRYQLKFMVEDPQIWEVNAVGDGLVIESTAFGSSDRQVGTSELTGFEALIEFLATKGGIAELDKDDYRNMSRPGFPALNINASEPSTTAVVKPRIPLKTQTATFTKESYKKQAKVTEITKPTMPVRPKTPEVPQKTQESTATKTTTPSPKKEESTKSKDQGKVKPSEGKGYKMVTKGPLRQVLTGGDFGSSAIDRSTRYFSEATLPVEHSDDDEERDDAGLTPVEPKTTTKTKSKKRVVKKEGDWYSESIAYNAKVKSQRKNDKNFIETLNFQAMSDDEKKRVDALYPRGHDAEIRRAPYTVANLIAEMFTPQDTTISERRWIRRRLLTGIGGKNAWMVSCLLTIYGNALSTPAWNELIDMGFLDTPYSQWNAKFGSYNDILRNQWSRGEFKHTPDDFPQMLYIATLVGRPNREVDWKAEDEKRMKVVPEIKCRMRGKMVELSTAQLRTRLRKMFETEGTLKVRPVQKFEDMYRTRYQWMIGGSMAGERTVVDTDPVMKKKLEEQGFQAPHHSTKKHIAERVSFEEVAAVLEMHPVNLAKGHTKGNENGKLRAIYGSLFSQYVIGRYWSYHIEQNVTFKSASMNKPNSQLLRETEDRTRVCANGDWVVCLDYTDFNASHSLKLMRLIIEVATEWAISKGFKPTEEFLKISDWYAKSFENSWYYNPESKEWVRVLSGLFSGLPQTTFDNTVANLTYDQCYFDSLRQAGIEITPTSRYVLGDDGWVSFKTKEEADLYLTAAKMGGIETNEIKQLVSKGRGEYLRLLYDNDGMIRGSPLRALANICHGSVESSVPSVGRTRIQELHSNISVLVRRGFVRSKMHRMFENLAYYEVNGKLERSVPVQDLLYGTRETGGLALVPIDSVGYDSKKRLDLAVPEKENNNVDEIAKVIFDTKGQKKFRSSSDFVNKIEERYSITWKFQGKGNATAMLAARNAVEGTQDQRYEHQILLVQARTARVDIKALRRGFEWKDQKTTFNMSADDIEKLFGKAIANDDRVLSSISPYIRVIRYMNDECREKFITQLAAETGVTLATIKQGIKSLASLGGENIDYLPTPYLSQELLGVLSKWRTIRQFTGEREFYDPQWIIDLAHRHKY